MQFPRGFAHGELLRGRRVGGLLLAELGYAPGQRLAPHAHANAR